MTRMPEGTGPIRRGAALGRAMLGRAMRGRRARLLRTVALCLGVAGSGAGCGALDVSDPTAIEDQEVEGADGAALLRASALAALSQATQNGAYYSGLLADEFLADPPSWSTGVWADEVLDRRESVPYEPLLGGFYANETYQPWQRLRYAATVAMPKLRTYLPAGAAEAKVGEMLALRGFATLRLAEDVCPGFPVHDMVNYALVVGPPLSTEAALARALADFDSAAALAGDSARILQFAQVGRARTLLGLGRFEEAAAAVAGVPTDYVANAEYLESAGFLSNNLLVFGLFDDFSKSVANRDGGTGLDFVAAKDPRVPTDSLGTSVDGATGIYGLSKYSAALYPDPAYAEVPIVVASGIEARLIEAEAALQREDPSWLTILNELRRNWITPALTDTTDPGTTEARENLLFRERAFWLFATGHRLGDLRRLVRVYGRAAESVFPTGPYRLGGAYGTGTSIPFPAAKETPFNPAVTGCTSR